MPRNKTGGKKSKKKSSKHENEFDLDEKFILKPDEFQEYGMITKNLGSCRMLVDCASIVKNEEGVQNVIRNRMCTIRGKLKKRSFMNTGDVVIVALRDFNDNDKGDIIHKFSSQQANYLKKKDIIPFDFNKQYNSSNLESNQIVNENIDEFDFEEENDNEDNMLKNKVGKQRIMEFPSSESESEVSDEDYEIDDI